MLRTRLCELLGTEIPIIGAPMGPEIASLELAAAISNAGGLGMISFGGYAPVALKERISKLRTLTSKPFGVNVLLQGPHLPLPDSAFVDVCLDERVPVLSFFWGDCSQYVERAHKLGTKVCDQVGSVSAAKRAQRAGVDFIIAQGVEAGGHVAGTVGTMVLVPRVADSVAPTPVAATECNAHPVYVEKILAATEEDTVRTTLFGHEWPNAPHRTLRTAFVEQWLSNEKRGSEQRADEPIVGEVTLGGNRVPLRRFGGIPPASNAVGDVESMDFLAGQAVGLVQEIKPAGEIIQEVAAQAEDILAGRLPTITGRNIFETRKRRKGA